ncbi:MAG: hypothetical protein WDO13_00600 [Verrucomicrobiota bacterium]
MKPLLLSLAALLALCRLCPADDTAASSPPAGTTVIGIVFDAQPVENGLTFDRTHAQAAQVTLHGATLNAWQALSGSEPLPAICAPSA